MLPKQSDILYKEFIEKRFKKTLYTSLPLTFQIIFIKKSSFFTHVSLAYFIWSMRLPESTMNLKLEITPTHLSLLFLSWYNIEIAPLHFQLLFLLHLLMFKVRIPFDLTIVLQKLYMLMISLDLTMKIWSFEVWTEVIMCTCLNWRFLGNLSH